MQIFPMPLIHILFFLVVDRTWEKHEAREFPMAHDSIPDQTNSSR
jgi:hypothetical protein